MKGEGVWTHQDEEEDADEQEEEEDEEEHDGLLEHAATISSSSV